MTSPDDEEWGPWVEHDGKGCPVPLGMFVRIDVGRHNIVGVGRYYDFLVHEGTVAWSGWPYVARYRIRKPRALRKLIRLVENLPAPERDTV